jgi:hypothetical protein
MPVIYRPFLEKLGGETSASSYVGNAGELFYDPATTTLRISDGTTPGGSVVSGLTSVASNIIPSTDDTYSLGSAEKRWAEIHAAAVTADILKIEDGVHEKFQTKADATGTVTHDCSSGYIFYHTSPDANWTANFTNLNLSSTYATSVTLIITQGGTGYYPSAVQIGGSAQTINWQGNTTPTPSVNRIDVVTFSIICTSTDTYTVLGQLTGF